MTMKRWIAITCIVVFGTCAAFLWHAISRESGISQHAESPLSSEAGVGVDKFMTNVDRYRGVVRVEGVVSATSPTEGTLAIIDSKEFKECEVTTCARLMLPVRWSGEMPRVRDTVQVTGSMQKSGGKLVFVATELRTTGASGKAQ